MENKSTIQANKELNNNSVRVKAGKLYKYLKKWNSITSDKLVLNIVQGYEIPFVSNPVQNIEPIRSNYSDSEINSIEESIQKMLKSAAIIPCDNEMGQFVSTVFTVPKPDGTRRPILNLKKLNEFMESPHFKMETIKTATELISNQCFMAVVDLRDAYHAISISERSQKYLKFRWKGKLYKYTCLPFGLSLAPFLYTKLTKPVVAKLRVQGILVSLYLDDTLIIGRTYAECVQNVRIAIYLLTRLGLTINVEKSQLQPSQLVKYLGFHINSQKMQLSLPSDKTEAIINKCKQAQACKTMTIQKLAELVGSLVAAVPAVRYGLLYTRQFEMEKVRALSICNNNYNCKVALSETAKGDLTWWINALPTCYQYLQRPAQDSIIFTDASLHGWGEVCEGIETKGSWPPNLACLHINLLELYAVFFGLQALAKDKKHILVRVDNTTTLAYINRYGGCIENLHNIAKRIWQWAEANAFF